MTNTWAPSTVSLSARSSDQIMSSEIVLTIIAPDRPGLVQQISDLVAEHHGNWLESRMAHLAGSFAGILKLTVPADAEAPLLSALKALDDVSLQIATSPLHAGDPGPGNPEEATTCHLDVVGQDRPGIVRQISSALAERGINVEELHTAMESAAMSGEPLFRAQARLRIPVACDQGELQSALEAIGEDLMVDVRIA